MDRLISLSVGTEGSEDYHRTFQDMFDLAGNLGENHKYVNMSAQILDDDADDDEPEELHHDENTLIKVREAIKQTLLKDVTFLGQPMVRVDNLVMNVINSLQNAGILFRERPPRD